VARVGKTSVQEDARHARTLLLLARYSEPEASHRKLPRASQETLAEMVGTTRSRVNFFMNTFRKLGFIEYNGGLKINITLLCVACATDCADRRDSGQARRGRASSAPRRNTRAWMKGLQWRITISWYVRCASL
jgi:hypothetical protein